MPKRILKRFVRMLARCLHWLDPASATSAQTLAAVRHVGANLIFDIGANAGQFARDLRLDGFAGTIVSFEPLTEAHKRLEAAARFDDRWLIHPRVALGDMDGEIQMNIAGNSVSSSVLPMLEAHLSAANKSAYVSVECAQIARLDALAHQYLIPGSKLFVKIDTQGYEWQVLDGAAAVLKVASGVLLEMSLVPLYEGQRLWRDLVDRMEAEGFTLWAIQRGFTDARSGRSLQVDAIFLKEACPI